MGGLLKECLRYFCTRSGGQGALLRSCPPAFGLPLDLASQNTQPTRLTQVFGSQQPNPHLKQKGWFACQSEVKEEPVGRGT